MAAARKVANPGIVLDEIEKAGTSRHNGNLLDALLAMLEPETSAQWFDRYLEAPVNLSGVLRSEEHTSELQSLMRISYAVFCLKKKKHGTKDKSNRPHDEQHNAATTIYATAQNQQYTDR